MSTPLKGHEVGGDLCTPGPHRQGQEADGPEIAMKSSRTEMSASPETEGKHQVVSERVEVNSEETARCGGSRLGQSHVGGQGRR